jgi:MFS family permease
MKLDYKKTLYVGMAFFIISIFWQTYDSVIAKILIDKFGLNQTASGVVMALDNILAVFMLPLFGYISDRNNSKHGKRTPFIVIGTIVAAFAFIGLTFVDNSQTTLVKHNSNLIEQYEKIHEKTFERSSIEDWEYVINDMHDERVSSLDLKKIDAARFDNFEKNIYVKMSDILTLASNDGKISVDQISYLDGYYSSYLSERAWEVTIASPLNLIIFVIILLVALIAMSIFRSPAVALMPDVTVKPLRSKGNAIINLMGAAAGIISLIIMTVFGLSGASYVSYQIAFISTGTIMLIALAVFLITVKEVKWVKEREELEVSLNITENEKVDVDGVSNSKLPKEVFTSLILILSSVFLWYMGYNAVISKVSDYAPKILLLPSFTLPQMIASAVAIVSYIPIGIFSSKLGRRKVILIGVILLAICFGSVYFLNHETGWVMYIVFGVTGFAWAAINVNSFPMVVELSRGSNIGKYTGYYYTFSMAAQIITPIFSGFLMDSIHQKVLFPYAAIFVLLSFVTMLFVKHGDSKVDTKDKSLLEHLDVDMD